ncbi:uncharacterized protein MONBRDRAFT_12288 [Monosiga brevicollis MX1]|uniref:EGF-like domain-containing protein n=1 Tax=Monosiga brevicollis TaxID=81824 RepID=A9VBT5_MONBE|nr:uncharacterized protein MONBRDRAFT_12288 [Monosiga brevicollis MX1]EDQ85034.1 predicted protein [Monosiga brevicollis MX1]|eukprot:XP_001750204.1 hypothetical protein [Monosiga brevicollis MX1]
MMRLALAIVALCALQSRAAVPAAGQGVCQSNVDCSAAGVCHEGTCQCETGYTGEACQQLNNLTIPVNSGFRMDDYHIWGAQVVKVNETYHMFASAYNASLNFFQNWLYDAIIVRATATHPLGPFTFQNVVLDQIPGRWDKNPMNPKIVRAADGTFLLFYTGDADDQGLQRVGMAYSATVDGNFTRVPHPVLEPAPPGAWDSRITTNCAVTVRPDGGLLMVYKASCCAEPASQTQVCLGVAGIDDWRQFNFSRLSPDPIIPCPANSFNFEDPSVYYDPNSDYYHLIIKDEYGTVTHDGYSGAHFISPDGIHYNVTTPALSYWTSHVWSDGRTRRMNKQERPEVLLDEHGSPLVAYFATDTELDGSQNKTWNMAIPLNPSLL